MTSYEWIVETLEGEDIVDVIHCNSYGHAVDVARLIAAKGTAVAIGLVRDQGNETEGLQNRQWAYLDKDGRLPEWFDGRNAVPKKYHREVEREN
jgi:hypothetical protein